MQLGALLPFGDIGGDPAVLREYAQAAESVGYDFIEAPDHVLGQNPAGASSGERIADGLYHDPFVLFGYLAGICPKLGFSTGVLILPQRQTVLVAKQAACLDVLCGGRFRLGIGVGWNEIEFTGLNENFTTAAAAPRSRFRLCRNCGRRRMSPSRAVGTRSTMPASTRALPRARCQCGLAAMSTAPWSASPNSAMAGCRMPIRRIRALSMSSDNCAA